MSKVYIIQNTHKLNRDTQVLQPKYDFETARHYGDLVFLLTPSAKPHDPSVVAELLEKLADYTDKDHLLLVGNPTLIGFACAIASDVSEGKVNVLQWDGKGKEYVSIKADLWRFYEKNSKTPRITVSQARK